MNQAIPSQSICVFCASSSDVAQPYKDAAIQMGRLCAGENWRVVYGGAHAGLMGLMADSALAHGGKVTGVIPELLKVRESAHEGLTKLYITKDMHERQMTMMELADAFVVLPGGLGTLAEFFEVLTWKYLGLHDKPIILMNISGYWDSLQEMIIKSANENFLDTTPESLFKTFSSFEKLKDFLQIK